MKKLIVFISVFLLTFSNAYAFSNDDWLKVPEQQNENTKVSGSKTYSDGRKASSSITIPPNVSRVVRQIVKLGAVVAVTDAITQLIGAGVDWVLDPANNQIRYIDPNAIQPPQNYQYYFLGSKRSSSSVPYPIYYTLKQACADQLKLYFPNEADPLKNRYCGAPYPDGHIYYYNTGNSTPQELIARRYSNPAYDPSAPPSYQYKSYEELARQIIANAAAAKPNAPEFILLSNTDLTPEEEKALDQQLDAAKKYDTNNTANSDSETKDAGASEPKETTKTETEYPGACEWMPTICEFADKAKEFMNDPDPLESPTLPEKQLDNQDFNPNLYNVSQACPPPNVLNMTLPGGVVFTKEFEYDKACQVAEDISPIFLIIGYLTGAFIIVRFS